MPPDGVKGAFAGREQAARVRLWPSSSPRPGRPGDEVRVSTPVNL